MLEPIDARFIKTLPFFAGLPAAETEDLCRRSSIRNLEKGEGIFFRGDSADLFYVILSGWVKIYRDTQEGDEAILGLFTRADTFGEAVMLGGSGYPYSAQAVENSRVIAIPAHVLKDRARENPEILVRMMQMLAQHMTRLQLENEHLSIMSAPQRVGCLLLQLTAGMEGRERTIHFPYDKSLAATRLGMKPETFSRALAQLKSIKVTVQGDNIRIADADALVEFVCADCSAGLADCEFSDLHACSPEERSRCIKTLKGKSG